MRTRLARVLLAALMATTVSGCGSGESDQPAAIAFTKVDLPAGAMPVVLAASGDALLIGIRRDGQPLVPGVLRRGPDGVITEIPVEAATPYGVLARWTSIASDGRRVVAVGGERGGAHGNVRWSVWDGRTTDKIIEKRQGFSTFGGYGAGDVVDAVVTPAGPALIGNWQSAQVGFDVAMWTPSGDEWNRHSSAGTALESRRGALGFGLAATVLEQGILVGGWQLATEAGRSRELPVVWRSSSGTTGWTVSPLPDSGQAGAALAPRCWGATCGVAGRVDGKLAVWRLADDAWTRLTGTPPIAVGDRDRLAAPIEIDGQPVLAVPDNGRVTILRTDGDTWTARGTAGPTGTVTAFTTVGDSVYLVAGPDENSQSLWRADIAALR